LTCLVGPNGSGKSTAVKVMAGVLAPGSGAVRIDGRPADEISPVERARRVGYLPQDFVSHWDLTVRDLLALGMRRGLAIGWLPGRAPDLALPPALLA
ncbi:ATP-binding cassette domain-containing protein, partial [Klebsiella pneumoniae]|uniref:ATP-binding cassette domain-containing protein n=1 Tax=Klebsiella pneumoniae TaxID=573 RepID=UPI003EE2951D